MTDELFPIRTVSTLTGVNVITLRAWERRYGLIEPVRTPSGHRMYRRADIDRIHRALALMEKGMAISQVRQHLDASAPALANSPWNEHQQRMVMAIAQFDDDELERIYNHALESFPIEKVTDKLLLPLLQELGRRWESSEGSVAEEHFFGVYLRNKLGARFHHRTRIAQGPRLLAACLPDEQHEVGLLLFALAAHERSLRPLLLGPNLPLTELPVAVKQARADGIVLSGSIAPPAGVMNTQLARLVREASVPVFVGGQVSLLERDAIVNAGAIPLGIDIPVAIERIRSALTSVTTHDSQ